MADETFTVVVTSGSLRPTAGDVVVMPHRWTPGGVAVEADFTGAHLFLLAPAGCVLNDVHREAERMGITVEGVRVRADGGFDADTWSSTGIEYEVEIASPASDGDLDHLQRVVDDVAEIPKALRSGTTVVRRPLR